MTTADALAEVRALEAEIIDLDGIVWLLRWDQQTMMPPKCRCSC